MQLHQSFSTTYCLFALSQSLQFGLQYISFFSSNFAWDRGSCNNIQQVPTDKTARTRVISPSLVLVKAFHFENKRALNHKHMAQPSNRDLILP